MWPYPQQYAARPPPMLNNPYRNPPPQAWQPNPYGPPHIYGFPGEQQLHMRRPPLLRPQPEAFSVPPCAKRPRVESGANSGQNCQVYSRPHLEIPVPSLLDRNIAQSTAMMMATEFGRLITNRQESAVSPPRMTPPPPVDGQARTQDMFDKTMTENIALKDQNTDYVKQLSAKAAIIQDLEAQLNNLQKSVNRDCEKWSKRLDEMFVCVEEKEERIRNLLAEKEQLEAKLRPGQVTPGNGVEISLQGHDHQPKAETDRQRLEVLEAAVACAKVELAALQQENKKLSDENKKLSDENKKLSDDNSKLSEEKIMMQIQCSNAIQARDEWKNRYNQLLASRDDNEKKNSKEEEIESLKKELDSERARVKGQSTSIENYEEELKKLKLKYAGAKRQWNEMQQKCIESDKQLAAKTKELDETKEKLEAANTGNNLLAKYIKVFKIIKEKLKSLLKAMQELKKENATLKSDTKAIKSQFVAAMNKNASLISEKIAAISSASDAVIASLKEELKKAESDLESAGEKLQESNLVQSSMQEDLEKLQKKVGELEEALKVKEKALNEAKKEKESAQEDCKKMRQEFKVIKKERSSLEKQLETVKGERDQLATTEEKSRSSTKKEAQALKAERDQLANQVYEKETAVKALEEDKQKLVAAVQAVERDLHQMKAERDQIAQGCRDKEAMVKTLTAEKEKLRAEITRAELECRDKNFEFKTVKEERVENVKTRESMEQYKVQYEQSSEQLNRLVAEKRELEAIKEAGVAELEAAKEKIKDLESQIKGPEANLEAVEAAQAKVIALEAQVAELRKSNRAARVIREEIRTLKDDEGLRALNADALIQKHVTEIEELQAKLRNAESHAASLSHAKTVHATAFSNVLLLAQRLERNIPEFAKHDIATIQEEKKKSVDAFNRQLRLGLEEAHKKASVDAKEEKAGKKEEKAESGEKRA